MRIIKCCNVLLNQMKTDQACLADLVVSFTQLLLHFRVILSCVAELLVHLLYLIQQCFLCLQKKKIQSGTYGTERKCQYM